MSLPLAPVFVDTNVFVYSVDAADPLKQTASRHWIDALWISQKGRVSWQVLHEFYVTTTRKLRIPIPRCREIVEALTLWNPNDVSFGLIERAWHWMDSTQLSYWDSLILASAERQGCEWLLTEDLSSGQRYGTVTVINPFEQSPNSIGLAPVSGSRPE